MTDTAREPPTAVQAEQHRHRGGKLWLTALAIVSAVLVIAYLFAPRPESGVPLDPSSPGPSGTKALIETLGVLGADVTVDSTSPDARIDTTLILVDTLSGNDRDEVEEWVRSGGTLVLTDPDSLLTPAEPAGGAGIGFLDPVLHRRCRVPAIVGAQQVEAPGAILMKVPEGSTGCFDRGGSAWLVVTPVGRGTIVTIGGPAFLVNGQLGEADNAVLIAALLSPTRGQRVSMLRPPPPGGGREGILDLIPSRVTLALVQLGIAFCFVVLWRGRRLGRPVVEIQPVELAGSELVVAVGNLMQRAKGRAQAATILRQDLRRTLCERLGLPLDLPVDAIAGSVAARTGIDSERVLQVLGGDVPKDEAELVVLSQSIESIRQEVTSVRDPATQALTDT